MLDGRVRINIRTLDVTGKTGEPLDGKDVLDGNSIPLIDGLTDEPETTRQGGPTPAALIASAPSSIDDIPLR